jgi:hypothetical protein
LPPPPPQHVLANYVPVSEKYFQRLIGVAIYLRPAGLKFHAILVFSISSTLSTAVSHSIQYLDLCNNRDEVSNDNLTAICEPTV